MKEESLRNVNIVSYNTLPTPENVRAELPVSDQGAQTVIESRTTIQNILNGTDPRLVLVVGPCSIHDPEAAVEYASKLASLSSEVSSRIHIVMRAYFEKPRTTVGWKGFINDPDLNDSFQIGKGLIKARELLLEINSLGLAVGTEALDPITPQYLDDLLSWAAIGARTVESQTHREMASGLSMPVGFKNGTDGSIAVMINAIKSVAKPHHFLGMDKEGRASVFHTRGNQYAHGVLRGGKKPNYDQANLENIKELFQAADIKANLMVDCSHGNSGKDPERQPLVFNHCIDQIRAGDSGIIGLMLESNLAWGKQSIPKNLADLKYGVSVTDACIDWKTTEELVLSAYKKLA